MASSGLTNSHWMATLLSEVTDVGWAGRNTFMLFRDCSLVPLSSRGSLTRPERRLARGCRHQAGAAAFVNQVVVGGPRLTVIARALGELPDPVGPQPEESQARRKLGLAGG